MKIGLGTGSTAEAFLELLAEQIQRGLQVVGTPTSERTAEKARSLGIPMADLNELKQLDLVVDGADEANPDLDLIKGGGGALLREKVVAASSSRMVVIADESKFRMKLGRFPVPVEVIAFGHVTTKARIVAAAAHLGYGGLRPVLRQSSDGGAYLTDNGNCIYDCPFGEIHDAGVIAALLSQVTGVVEHGLFCGLATWLVLAGSGGVRVIERPRP